MSKDVSGELVYPVCSECEKIIEDGDQYTEDDGALYCKECNPQK